MAAKDPDPKEPAPVEHDDASTNSGWNKRTEFGEPLWVDVLKTLGVGIIMLSLTIIVGGALGVAIMAPWGRASPDCSIYCVLRQQFKSYFPDEPSESGGRPIEREFRQLANRSASPRNRHAIGLRKTCRQLSHSTTCARSSTACSNTLPPAAAHSFVMSSASSLQR